MQGTDISLDIKNPESLSRVLNNFENEIPRYFHNVYYERFTETFILTHSIMVINGFQIVMIDYPMKFFNKTSIFS